MVMDVSCWYKCHVLVTGTCKCIWWEWLVHRVLVVKRLGKALYGFTSGIRFGGSGLSVVD